MRKYFLLLIILLLFLPTEVAADNKSATITFSGTTETNCYELAIVEVHSITQTALNNIEGTITYDKSQFAVFKIDKNDGIGNWNFTIDYSTPGTIKFKATSNSDSLLSDVMLFKITFIAHGHSSTTTTIKSSSVTSSLTTKEEVEEEVVVNQKEIDEAKNAGKLEEEWPEPIIEKVKKEVEKTETISYTDSSHTVKISKKVSSDCYLKDLSVEDGTISPVFNKLTSAYKVTIDKNKEININYVVEDPKSTVVIQEEKNNQIVITVTAENGENNTYVLTIVRQENYSPNNSEENIDNPDISNSDITSDVNQNTTVDGNKLSLPTIITLSALTAVSIIGLTIGAILIYKGSRE